MMKKTILSLAVLLASSIGVSALAQTPGQNARQAVDATTAATVDAKKVKGERKNAPKHNPFEGLNLTEQQQARLDALKPTAEQRAQAKAEKQAKKEADRKARFEQRAQQRRDYLAKVKAILSPEQYMQFLENNYVDNAPAKKMMGKKAGRKDGDRKDARRDDRKGGMKHKGGQRPDGGRQQPDKK